MNSPPETLCFIENSRAWQKGQIKLDVYFGNMVEHFNGTRHHPGDDERVDKVLFYLDRIGHSVWDCLWDSSLKPVKGSTWMIHFLCVSLVMAPEPSWYTSHDWFLWRLGVQLKFWLFHRDQTTWNPFSNLLERPASRAESTVCKSGSISRICDSGITPAPGNGTYHMLSPLHRNVAVLFIRLREPILDAQLPSKH